MPPATTDDDNENQPDRPMRRLPDNYRWYGSVRMFRRLLVWQMLVLEGRVGGPNDGGEAYQPDE
jgi:hypothetical protein